jgi:uncharacterized alpha-E superfamily protein
VDPGNARRRCARLPSIFEIGRRLERALGLCATLRATLPRGPSAAPDGLRLEATLRAQASLIT